MSWDVEYTDEFNDWWESLNASEQEAVTSGVGLLEDQGPNLGFPHSSGVSGSRHKHMRELRIQWAGQPYRVLYAFDPLRCVILLIGGRKTGRDRWYKQMLPIADRLYDDHLDELRNEGRL